MKTARRTPRVTGSFALLLVAAFVGGLALGSLTGCGQEAAVQPPIDPPVEEPDYSVAPQWILDWGGFGSGDGQFHQPIGIAQGPDKTIYVADTQHHQIQKFTPEGEFLGKLGSAGPLHFPKSVAVGKDGRVFVGDHTVRIHVYSPEGQYETFLDYHVAETALITSRDGNLLIAGYKILERSPILIAEGPGVWRVSPEGQEIDRWNAPVDKQTTAWFPTGIAEDVHGNVFVSGSHFAREEGETQTKTGEFVWSFNKEGVIRGRFGIESVDGEHLGFEGIAVDSRGSVYVADWRAGVVRRFSSTGEEALSWKTTGSQPMRAPVSILVDAEDRIYVADWGLNVVIKFGYN